MTAQLYWVNWTYYPRCEEEMPRPAQFVHQDNDSDEVIGFIAEVDYNKERCQICLLQPQDVNVVEMELVSVTLSDNEVAQLLRKAFKANPNIKRVWAQILAQS